MDNDLEERVLIIELEHKTFKEEFLGTQHEIKSTVTEIAKYLYNNPKTDEKGIISRLVTIEEYVAGKKLKDRVYGAAFGSLVVVTTWIINHFTGFINKLFH